MDNRAEHDEWLMTQVARGRRDCLQPLMRRYAGPLLTFIQRMLGDHHRSEELFQETFLTVWIKRSQYEFPRTFKSWLYAITLNKCRAAFRNRSTFLANAYNEEPENVPASPAPSPADTLVASETATLVSKAVANLPAHQRAVVVLRIWEGMSFSEIAETVGKPEGTVRSQMHYGLAALRKSLESKLD
jgi:RNA polymerase sigma-70 factor (ECF subfamily)